jgi:hypothetical protein
MAKMMMVERGKGRHGGGRKEGSWVSSHSRRCHLPSDPFPFSYRSAGWGTNPTHLLLIDVTPQTCQPRLLPSVCGQEAHTEHHDPRQDHVIPATFARKSEELVEDVLVCLWIATAGERAE